MENIIQELLELIISFLPIHDAISTLRVSKKFAVLRSCDSFWEKLCLNTWKQMLPDIFPLPISNKSHFKWFASCLQKKIDDNNQTGFGHLFDLSSQTFFFGKFEDKMLVKIQFLVAVYKVPHNSFYVGDYMDFQRHGIGKWELIGKNTTYDGEWKNNYMDGKGIYRTLEKEYEGYWRAGMKHGYGICRWRGRDDYIEYRGEWQDDKQHGHGTLITVDGDIIEGDFKFGKLEGKGKVTWKDESIYEGELNSNLKRHGFGIHRWKDGTYFEGNWKDNKSEGQGIYQWKDGSRYEGAWKDSERCGVGKLTSSDGTVYVGEWKHNKRHGKGTEIKTRTMKTNEGQVIGFTIESYQGDWRNGKKHGKGVYTRRDGAHIEGIWINGKLERETTPRDMEID